MSEVTKTDLMRLSARVTTAESDIAAIEAASSGLTPEQVTDLTDGGQSALHYHDSDRARANHTGTQAATTVTVAKIGTPTYTTVQHAINLIASTGMTSGGLVTDAGSETVNIAAGTGWIKATDSDVAEVMSFDWAAANGLAVAANTVKYAVVEYNAGSPQATIYAGETWDLDTSFPLAKIINENGVLHILNNPWWVGDGVTNIIERLQSFGIVTRDMHVGGLMLSVSGTRSIAVTAGKLWSRLNEFPITAVDTNVSGTVETYYRSGASAWTNADVSQYPITQYNRLSDNTLQTIGNNQYFNWWVYIEADDDEVSLVYPQATYANAALAEAESPPSSIPVHISESGILIGRILCKQGVDAPVEVQSAFTTTFTASAGADHGNLSGLADDDHAQYLLASGTRALTGNMAVDALVTIDGRDLSVDGSKLDGIEAGATADQTASEFNHNDLSSKQGGTTNEYYHLTSAQATVVGNTSGTNTGDQTLPTRDSLGLDTDDTVAFANLSGTNTGDQDLSGLIAKTTNITSLNETGIADGEIAVFNLTNKDIRTSNVTIVTSIGADDTTIPTSEAVTEAIESTITSGSGFISIAATIADDTITVDDSGGKDFTTIQAAIDSLPMFINHSITIEVYAGTYAEAVEIIGFQGMGKILLTNATGEDVTVTSIYKFRNNCEVEIRGEATHKFIVSTTTAHAIRAVDCTNAMLTHVSATGSAATYIGAYADNSSVYINASTFSNKLRGVLAAKNSIVTLMSVAGTGNSVGVLSGQSIVNIDADSTITGTTPRTAGTGGLIVEAGTKTSEHTMSVNRKDYTSDSVVSNQRTQKGWTYIQGNASSVISIAITFAVEYDVAPIVVCSMIGGAKLTANGAPSAVTDFGGSISTYGMASPKDITTTGFTLVLYRAAALASNTYYGATWIAEGTEAR